MLVEFVDDGDEAEDEACGIGVTGASVAGEVAVVAGELIDVAPAGAA